MNDPMPLGWWRRDPGKYQVCAWMLCKNECSNRYQLPLCQQHILFIWSMVDADIRESGKTAEDVRREERARLAAEERHTIERNRARARRDSHGFVYYLEVGGMIKIGFTKNAWRRGGEYPPSAQLLAMHYGTQADERKLHERFAAYREAGREWYMDCQEIRDHIATLNAAPGDWQRRMGRKRPARSLRKPTRTVLM